MAQKYLQNVTFFSLLSSLFASLFASSPATAEVACVVEVSYRWVREQTPSAAREASQEGEPKPKESKAGTAAPAAGAAGATGPTEVPKTPTQAARPGEQQVRVASVERRGKDERAAKAGLLVEVNRQKSRAHERCKRDHESFGDCVSTKLSAKSSTIQSLSFSARAKVEEALIEECRVQQGQCVSIDASEPVCRDLSGAPLPSEGSPGNSGEAAPEAGKGQGVGGQGSGGQGAAAGKNGAEKAPEAGADKGKAPKKKP